jgi:methionyl-tRNA synthetase
MKDRWYKRTTVTSALPYANGPLHIGHLAGVYIPADIYVRYLRSKGEDVLFIGGSDEHGVPITIKARQQGLSPQEVVDRYHGMIKDSFNEFGISFDIYSRTSNPIHHETAAHFFTVLYEKGEFIEKTGLQYFDEEHQTFLADRYITGTCPRCGNEKAYGDQCESCGTSLSPDDLINPRSALSGQAPVKKETRHWYLPLDKYQDWLTQWIVQGHKDDWTVQILARPRPAAPCCYPRPRLGSKGAAGGSLRESVVCLVRRADRLYLRNPRMGCRKRHRLGIVLEIE